MLLRNSQLKGGMLVRNSSGRGPMVVRNDTRPPPPPSLLPPDYKPEIRPHYPGGWGSGVGSQASRAVTLAVSRRRGRSGPAFRALARFCLPRRVPCVAPAKAPCVAPAKAPCVAPATGGGDGPTDRGLFFAAQGRTRNAASRTRNCRDVLPPR